MGIFTSTPEERKKRREEISSFWGTGFLLGFQKDSNARKEARQKREDVRKKRIDVNTL